VISSAFSDGQPITSLLHHDQGTIALGNSATCFVTLFFAAADNNSAAPLSRLAQLEAFRKA
jgi:hypothetical protein